MSKTKQILAILFPHGFWHTYIPATIILFIQLGLAALNHSAGVADWAILLNCICITFALHSFYKTYLYRKYIRDRDVLMQAVFDTVRPQLEELHSKKMQNGFDPIAFRELMQESRQIIDAEIERRKNLAEVSKTGKP